jgi:hypothetical protein
LRFIIQKVSAGMRYMITIGQRASAASSVAVPLATIAASAACSASVAWPKRVEIGRSRASQRVEARFEIRVRLARRERHEKAYLRADLVEVPRGADERSAWK